MLDFGSDVNYDFLRLMGMDILKGYVIELTHYQNRTNL